jgi:hypothetical protein
MSLIIRKASDTDLPFIHELVRELAIFEKEEKEFTATLSMYENDFRENIFQSIVAELDDEIVFHLERQNDVPGRFCSKRKKQRKRYWKSPL